MIGKLYKQELIIQGLGTLGALLNSGTPALESLTITARSARSLIFKAVLARVKEQVENGVSLSAALEQERYFPNEVVQMVKVGESTGQLGEMLVSIADFQTRERELLLKRLTALLEPALTLLVGGMVGVIVLAMFLPLVNMISTLQ